MGIYARSGEPSPGRSPGRSLRPGVCKAGSGRPRSTGGGPAGSPQAALDALVTGQTRAQWECALRDLAWATDRRSKERWNEALATALIDPSGEQFFRRWDPPAQGHRPRIFGSLQSLSGRRRVQILLDSGATTSFIDTALADQLGLPADGAVGPSVARSANGELTPCRPPVTTHLALGLQFQESLPSPPSPSGPGTTLS